MYIWQNHVHLLEKDKIIKQLGCNFQLHVNQRDTQVGTNLQNEGSNCDLPV